MTVPPRRPARPSGANDRYIVQHSEVAYSLKPFKWLPASVQPAGWTCWPLGKGEHGVALRDVYCLGVLDRNDVELCPKM